MVNIYNFQVSRNLFRWTKEVSYADYYERALTNGVLGIQRGTEPGLMIYMLPLGKGVSKAVTYHGWGTPYDSFWCCYGTGKTLFNHCYIVLVRKTDKTLSVLFVCLCLQVLNLSQNWETLYIFKKMENLQLCMSYSIYQAHLIGSLLVLHYLRELNLLCHRILTCV